MTRHGNPDGERAHVEHIERVRLLGDPARRDLILGPLRRGAVERDPARPEAENGEQYGHDVT